MSAVLRLLQPLLGLALLVRTVTAQRSAELERRELEIPMRDGVALFAVALIPKGATAPLPILLIRTPFNAAREFRSTTLPPSLRELGEDGYIFVCEDIRGRFGSGGTFVSLRPQRDPRDTRGVDESTDAWDTVDWLVRQLPNNSGKVGVLGVSYRGWLAALAASGRTQRSRRSRRRGSSPTRGSATISSTREHSAKARASRTPRTSREPMGCLSPTTTSSTSTADT
jgi:hypothetical protein